MSDILDDYREWAAEQPQHVSTHSDRCHMWPRHEACMIHRLAAELESATRHMELVEAAWLRETSGNPPVSLRLTEKEAAVARYLADELRGISDSLNVVGNDFSDILYPAARELERQFSEMEEIERLRLTDAEREAVDVSVPAILFAADALGLSQADCDRLIATLRGLLKRHFPVPEKRSLQDNDPSASENLPSGNDTPKMHCNSDKFTDR